MFLSDTDADSSNKPGKRPTAADQFADYQNEYEARAKTSVHGIRQVEEHNKNYPKLNVELDKRRSIAQVNCSRKRKHREDNNRQRCSTSKKITRMKVNRQNDEPVKMFSECHKRRENGVRKNGQKKSRAAGASCKRRGYCVCALDLEKKIKRRRLNSISQLIGNSCCACKQVLRRALCNEDPTNDGNKKDLREIYSRGSRDSDRNSVDSKSSSKSLFIGTPGSDKSSVTSYRSVGSMNQEPMV